jgi:hypothetical protein
MPFVVYGTNILPQKIFSVTIILTSDEQLDMLLNPILN